MTTDLSCLVGCQMRITSDPTVAKGYLEASKCYALPLIIIGDDMISQMDDLLNIDAPDHITLIMCFNDKQEACVPESTFSFCQELGTPNSAEILSGQCICTFADLGIRGAQLFSKIRWSTVFSATTQ